jgi:2'-5' RNA ligase
LRLFVALHLAPDLLEELSRLQAELRRLDHDGAVRWVDPKGIHLTLEFLGDVAAARVPQLREALAGAQAGRRAPFLSLGSTGAFPNLRRPRVLWVGLVEEGDRLVPLQRAVEAALSKLGFGREERPFQPHLTLGRARDSGSGPARLGRLLLARLEDARAPIAVPVPQTRLSLVQSHLGPRGSRYEDLESWSLVVG